MEYFPCNLCSRDDYETIRPYPGFEGVDIVRCRGCGLTQAQPTPSEDFLRSLYQTDFGRDPVDGLKLTKKSERGSRLRAEHQFDFVRKHVASGELESEGGSVLDVGCRAASFLALFKKRGWAVTGLDPNPRSAYAREWYGIDVIPKLFEKGLFPDGAFDAVLHSHALEHVPDPKGVLAEFYRVLKPGGWVFIEVPNETRERIAALKLSPHLYFFTPDTLSRLARETGFDVVTTRVLDIGPRNGSLASKQALQWLARRWSCRYDARGRVNLLTLVPYFGRLFKEDRYFKRYEPQAAMLRILLRKPAAEAGIPRAKQAEAASS